VKGCISAMDLEMHHPVLLTVKSVEKQQDGSTLSLLLTLPPFFIFHDNFFFKVEGQIENHAQK
jgi:hypothetical protein